MWSGKRIFWQLYRSQPSFFYLYQVVTGRVAMRTDSVQQRRSNSLLCCGFCQLLTCAPPGRQRPTVSVLLWGWQGFWHCSRSHAFSSNTLHLAPFTVWTTLKNMNNAILLVVIAPRESWGAYFVRNSSSVCRQQYMQVLHLLLQKMSNVNAQKYVNCLFLETSLESFAYSVISQRTSSVYSCLELGR